MRSVQARDGPGAILRSMGFAGNMPIDIGAAPATRAAARGPLWLAALVLAAGLASTAAGSVLLYDAALQRDRQRLEEEATAKARQLELAIELSLESLHAVRALFDANLPLDAERFEGFVRSDAARHRGTLALGWAPRVTAEKRPAFEHELARLLERPEAAVFEATGHGQRRTAAERPVLYPLQHLAALGAGDIEPGLDLASLASRRQAIEAAVASGQAAASKVRRADVWSTPGELVIQAFLPVRDTGAPGAAPRGVVVGVFSVSDILRRVFGSEATGLRAAIFDRSAPPPEQRLFALGLDDEARNEEEWRDRIETPGVQRRFLFAGREWVAYFLPAAGAASSARLLWPLAGLLGGLLLTTLLTAYLFAALARGRQLLLLQRRLLDEQVATEVQRRLREQELAAAQARSSFLQAASHDLRQPLHALSLYLSLLGDEPQRGRDPAFMAQLQHSAAALQGLFDALLDIGRLESGQLEPRPRSVALRPLLRGLVEESRAAAQRKGLRLVERLEPVAGLSDPLLLERIVRNLLVNALRYTPSGWVALRCIARGGRLRLQVFDSGPGLPRERRARLFEPCAGDRADRGGVGLGLAIVQELARRLGHPLRVRSRAGRGSVFTLELSPAEAEAQAPEPQPAAARREPWPDGHVLLVEDDPEVRAATAARLRAWGATVEEAGSLAEARASLAEGRPRPALLLLDVQLPDGRGTELREALGAGASPPIVWVTADPKLDRLDAEIVLHKPVTALKLRSALDAARRRDAPARAD